MIHFSSANTLKGTKGAKKREEKLFFVTFARFAANKVSRT